MPLKGLMHFLKKNVDIKTAPGKTFQGPFFNRYYNLLNFLETILPGNTIFRR